MQCHRVEARQEQRQGANKYHVGAGRRHAVYDGICSSKCLMETPYIAKIHFAVLILSVSSKMIRRLPSAGTADAAVVIYVAR